MRADLADGFHELRRALNGVVLQVEVAKLKLGGAIPDADAAREALAVVGDELQRAIRATTELEATTRRQPGAPGPTSTRAAKLDTAP